MLASYASDLVSGIATFSNIAVVPPGTYTLTVYNQSGSRLLSAVSEPFTVH